jgi:predicted O-linked N-acetylglucosamine transferase (SPINDLY family)
MNKPPPLPSEAHAALRWLKQGDPERCVRELEVLVARTPDHATLHNALGSVLAGYGPLERARASFERALALSRDYSEALSNLGNVLLEQAELRAALAVFERAVDRADAPAQAFVGLGRVLCLLGRHARANDAFEQALHRPGAHAGTWSQRCYATLLDPEIDARQLVAIHRACGEYLAPVRPATPHENDSHVHRKLRLGYVSADFREHSVACFLEGVLAQHDCKAIELYLYSDVRREDNTSRRLYALADHTRRCVRLSHAELAARCRADRIDVLIDLTGHMQPNRQAMFALAPAPVLFSYLGYPGTTGSGAYGARITDVWADPTDLPELAGPEPLLRISGGHLAYTPAHDAPDVSPLPAASANGVVFGCFNDALKLNDPVLATWAALLARCAGSGLLLKARQFVARDLRQRVLATFSALGVDPARIELMPATLTRREHLELYARVDIALDTFPYSGVTTSCEALYMGVPVITLAGDRHAARLGMSILSAIDLEAWVATDRAAYVERAVCLANDLVELARLRATLRETLRSSALCDSRRVASAIEVAAREHFAGWLEARRG